MYPLAFFETLSNSNSRWDKAGLWTNRVSDVSDVVFSLSASTQISMNIAAATRMCSYEMRGSFAVGS